MGTAIIFSVFFVGVLALAGPSLMRYYFEEIRPAEIESAEYEEEPKTVEQIVAELDRMPWVDEPHTGIIVALGRKKITGCGSVRYKLVPDTTSEYMVECSDRYDRKTGYLVWPNTGGVLGSVRKVLP